MLEDPRSGNSARFTTHEDAINDLWGQAAQLEALQDAMSASLERAALTHGDDAARGHYRRIAEEIGVDLDDVSAKLNHLLGR